MVRERFQEQVAALQDRLAEMADHAKLMLRDGVRGLGDLDLAMAEDLQERTQALAEFDEQIEAEVFRILTLQSPVAGDLRRLGATLKIISYLYRIGRYGRDIGKVVTQWPEGKGHVARMVSIPAMAEKVVSMLDLVLDAYNRDEVPDLEALSALEVEVDALRYSIFREALTYMMEAPSNIEPMAHYMMVARYLERCGDNVCKMAEKLYYAATGEHVWVD